MGARIAQARRRLGVAEWRDIGQSDMARDLGVSPQIVRSWEAGEKQPRETMLERVAGYLGVTPAWLRYGVQEVDPTVVQPAPRSDELKSP